MALTIELEPAKEKSLRDVALLQGVDATDYARRLIEQHLPDAEDAATFALFAAWDKEDETDDPVELEARRAEWEELKTNLEANRLSLRRWTP